MNAAEIAQLQQRFHAGIPLSRAMGYQIASLSDNAIVVEAPFAPNVNVHGTVFAGSLFALGILTAWGLAMHILREAGFGRRVGGCPGQRSVPFAGNVRYRLYVRGRKSGGRGLFLIDWSQREPSGGMLRW